MKYTMGDFGANIPADDSGGTLISTAANLAQKSLDTSFDKVAQIAKAQEVQAFIEANNLGPYIKDITADRIKTFLAFLGFYTAYKAIKTPIGLAVLGGGAIYIMFQTRGKTIEKVSNTVAQNTPALPPSVTSTNNTNSNEA